MARFSVGRDDDEGGTSRRPNPKPKRMRSEISTSFDTDSEDGGEREPSEEEQSPADLPSNFDDVDEVEGDTLADDLRIGSVTPSSSRPVTDVAEVVADNGADVDGCHVMTLSDPDVLDCPICLDPLTVPVFQCENGHVACSSCSTKVRNKCPSCTFPIGYKRCRAIEKVIESVKVSCRNIKYGCMEKISYCYTNEHENSCRYAPCSCPFLCCPFKGSVEQLSKHFNSGHPYGAMRFVFGVTFRILIDLDQKYVVLQENEGLLFIINNLEFQSLGNIIAVSCIRPRSSEEEFSYNMVAERDGCVVKLESVAENYWTRPQLRDLKRFLMVPRYFVDSYGRLELDVKILNPLPKIPPRVVKVHLGIGAR